MPFKHEELEVVRNHDILQCQDYMDTLLEMRKVLGIIPTDVPDEGVKDAIHESIDDEEWFGLVDPCDDKLLCVALIYGCFHRNREKGDRTYSPIMSAMVFTPEKYRRKGYAERMLPEVAKRMHLNAFVVDSENEASKALVKKMGWVLADDKAEILDEDGVSEVYIKGAV